MTALSTTPNEGRLSFDVTALENYLRAHIDEFRGPLAVKRFAGGQSNPTYLLSTSQRCYVMRSKPASAAQLLPSAHAVEREFRVQSALANSEVPVASMYCLCEDEAVIGRAFYVMDFVEGRIFWEQSLPGMQVAERSAIYDELNRVIAAMHRVDVAAVGLADYGKAGNYFARQIDRWSRQYRASEIGRIEAMERLMTWLPEHIPQEEEPHMSLVHGDYRIDNVIFHPTEPRILAVIDWELSTLGHPLADFSYHAMTWHFAPGLMRGLRGLDLLQLGIPDERAYINTYRARTGLEIHGNWNFYLAYNVFRLAAIVQGIARRAQEGTASSAYATEHEHQVQPLAEMGWAFAEKAGAS